ncbi:tripartite motif-containing protein 2/3 [Mytilus galloprovincialis]|uniref:Tripartite motif-containing protein 2/3 n=1 Tax=Mytilus galloprovincialis TaxID=29158 RepID=A0A8B6F420_MYTGA|nr:tripartite motif-containing protein 2/3 [Mytilus galloprovincialis]
MATGNTILCGPCNVDDVTKKAWRWCTSCEEGLCENCEHVHRRSKSSRNHQVISIEDYRKIENVSISKICEQHGENLEWFCKSHDEVLCVVCVPSKHKACSDVIPISINTGNSRQSTALSDLEETIEGTMSNVKQCIKNRESATKEIEKQELAVKTMVLETRKKINSHLDKLQEKLIHEITSTSQICKSKYMKILRKLESTEEMIIKLREQTKHMKQFSSDIQVFLGTRQVTKRITHEVESIKSEIGAAKDYELKVSIHRFIEQLSNDIEDQEFGKIMVSESVTNLDFNDPKFYQAQIGINISTSRNISDIKLQFIRSFQMKREFECAIDINGCVILPNGNLLMTNYTKEKSLIEYRDTGEYVRDIPVSAQPYGIDLIDPSSIVVTYGDEKFLEIINTNTFIVEKKINLQKSSLGVSHSNGRLYTIAGTSIQVLDLSGRQLELLKTASQGGSYIKTSRDRIYYSNHSKNKIHCCHLNGEEIWELESVSLAFPKGVTVDDHNNVYAVGYISHNLTLIENDGENIRALLSKSDGLSFPKAVYYDKNKRTLLICNEGGKVALYKVV